MKTIFKKANEFWKKMNKNRDKNIKAGCK